MFTQKVTVHYLDGTSKEVTLDQYSLSQFAQYANRQGWKIDIENPGLLTLTMLRYQAWVELHRDPTSPKPQFEAWDRTVAEVTPEEAPAEVPPTPPGP